MVKIKIAAETELDARMAIFRLIHGWKHHRIKKGEPAAGHGGRFVYWLRLWN